MRILVTGKNGQVGREIGRTSRSHFDFSMAGREECDLSNPQSVRDLVRALRPEVILNTAAYTAVDRAETERDLCFAINATAPRVLAEEAGRLNAILVHYSTDYVFDGEKTNPYLESDSIHPLSVYGASKAEGETAVAASGSRYLIFRTSWVYSPQGSNFLRTVLRLGQEKPELRVVQDQIGAPTAAAAIADATLRVLVQTASETVAFPSGTYHMTAAGSTSWCGFARAIVNASDISPKPRVIGISTAEYPTPAKRPKNSVLSNAKFEHTFGFTLTPWQQQLEQVLYTMTIS
jgi:dTDP-4-dehydrorhamnose reductase